MPETPTTQTNHIVVVGMLDTMRERQRDRWTREKTTVDVTSCRAPQQRVLVMRIRAPNEFERRSASAVWLEGSVMEPPQISCHPDSRACSWRGPSCRL
jgi:hypothetical protein